MGTPRIVHAGLDENQKTILKKGKVHGLRHRPSVCREKERKMSEKVQFQTNVPVEVALKYNDGKEVTGQYGDQVLYTLTDGRVMYVPPIVKRKIDELRIGRGELFTLTKAEKKNGTRRTIEWVVAARERGDLHPPAGAQQPNGQRPPYQRNDAAVPEMETVTVRTQPQTAKAFW